ncbi:MAG: hypothetical protein QXE78_02010 [Nitrososphaeria archaeon]
MKIEFVKDFQLEIDDIIINVSKGTYDLKFDESGILIFEAELEDGMVLTFSPIVNSIRIPSKDNARNLDYEWNKCPVIKTPTIAERVPLEGSTPDIVYQIESPGLAWVYDSEGYGPSIDLDTESVTILPTRYTIFVIEDLTSESWSGKIENVDILLDGKITGEYKDVYGDDQYKVYSLSKAPVCFEFTADVEANGSIDFFV